jgi:hypothetical protein
MLKGLLLVVTFTELVEAESQPVHDVQICQPEGVELAGDECELLPIIR